MKLLDLTDRHAPERYIWVSFGLPWSFCAYRWWRGGCLGLGLLYIEIGW